MNEYKGIYYDANSEPKSYEGGAHFKYSELCQRLEELIKFLPKSRYGKSLHLNDDTCAGAGASAGNVNANSNMKSKQSRNEKTLLQSLTLKLSEITKDKNDINYNKTVELVGSNKHLKKNKQSNNMNSSNPKVSNNILLQEGIQSLKNKFKEIQYQSKPTRNKTQSDIDKVGNNTKNESFSHNKVNIPYNNSAFYLNHSNILIPKQNKRSLYHLIHNQKNNSKSISHTNEISSLSDLNSSAQDEVKIQGSNIIVQPKINISFVNNINTLGIPIDQRSRNIKQRHGQSLMKMNTSIKKGNINLYCTNQTPSFAQHQQNATTILQDNGNSGISFICKNKTPSPMKGGRGSYQGKGLHQVSQSKDKSIGISHSNNRVLQTQGNDNSNNYTNNIMRYFNNSKKYSALQKRINQMKLKSKNDLTKISVAFENLITEKKNSNSLSKQQQYTSIQEKKNKNNNNSQSKKKTNVVVNESHLKTQFAFNLNQVKPVSIKNILTTTNKPLMRNMVPVASSSKSYMKKSIIQSNSFLNTHQHK